MKIKNRTLFYVIGLILAFITFIPPLPKALQYLFALIPILFFGADVTIKYMDEFFKGNFINRHIAAIIVTVGLIATGKLGYSAATVIFFSASSHYFDTALKKAYSRINSSAEINAPRARVIIDGKESGSSVGSILPGHTVLLKSGDIVPCDCTVIKGEAKIDYTNIFGQDELKNLRPGSACFSGGIIQAGSVTATVNKAAKDSLVATISSATKRAHAPSPTQRKISAYSRIFEYAVFGIAVLLFIILMVATKDFPVALNLASIVLIAAPMPGMTSVLSLLVHNTVIAARHRGVIFSNMRAVEKCSKIQTVSPNEAVSEDVLNKISETGAVPARGGNTEVDAVLYRNRASLEADRYPSFKFALGFTSKRADAFALDGKVHRIAGAIRTAHNYRNIFIQNALVILVEKLLLIALAFLLNITPAAAVVIEFACWMICLFNATRD